jgi:hypothetical protein
MHRSYVADKKFMRSSGSPGTEGALQRMEGSYRALTLALAAFFCGGYGRAVYPKLHTGLLQVLLEHPTQSRNVAL